MPKLSKYREDYYYFSGKTSELSRQLALAGIVIVWIFKTGDALKPQLPKALLVPLALFVITLAFDLLHYISSTIIWGIFHRSHEKKLKDLTKDPELSAPWYYNCPANTFFTAKVISVIVAYSFLLFFFWNLWSDIPAVKK